MLRQEEWFRMAAVEAGISPENAIICHRDGTILIEEQTRQMVFPQSYFRHAATLDKTKKYKYSFMGRWAPHRNWLIEYCGHGSYILFNDYGRFEPAADFDPDYYGIMAQSEYVLCPAGCDSKDGYEWTYRFFEAILCQAVPLLKMSEYKNGLPKIYEEYIFVEDVGKDIAYPEARSKAAEFNLGLLFERATLCLH